MVFDLQPTLKGKLIELRPLTADDFDKLFAVASDPLIWEQHPASDRHEEPVFREFFRAGMESGGAFLVTDASTGQVIGSTRYFGFKEQESEVEIGWTFLARSHWGGRYNREMKDLMLRHAFQFVEHAVFLIGPQNIRSRRAVEKLGATQIANRVDANGREVVAYQLTRQSFKGL
jgi:RimJ/RimL family protein N-acetyltransferase